jgi:hypothetical protein
MAPRRIPSQSYWYSGRPLECQDRPEESRTGIWCLKIPWKDVGPSDPAFVILSARLRPGRPWLWSDSKEPGSSGRARSHRLGRIRSRGVPASGSESLRLGENTRILARVKCGIKFHGVTIMSWAEWDPFGINNTRWCEISTGFFGGEYFMLLCRFCRNVPSWN